ncbi:hypothetical protein H696_05289 [Fonticula alba]|uniref:Phosphatidate cytidylyltransferase, mitochondrial n=1 Tax=Fonticula alba TaxID=691883 RepID=A0A058Z371_FONAL|nr:hypothetical protein H696_05289 [Fonticula alba]KCV68373.1 hypothetical protein H696_05289 [Fonticula alba]|eukprot:XP_009497427.1 hypothetical protein H696_05289 [Fonticula alba]
MGLLLLGHRRLVPVLRPVAPRGVAFFSSRAPPTDVPPAAGAAAAVPPADPPKAPPSAGPAAVAPPEADAPSPRMSLWARLTGGRPGPGSVAPGPGSSEGSAHIGSLLPRLGELLFHDAAHREHTIQEPVYPTLTPLRPEYLETLPPVFFDTLRPSPGPGLPEHLRRHHKLLSDFVSEHFAHVEIRNAIGYGSGALPQNAQADFGQGKMLDFIFVVDRPEEFHRRNMERYPDHYPAYARLLGARMATRIQALGGGIYYNSQVTLQEQPVKYGVISTEAYIGDLLRWDSFYTAARLQKPTMELALRGRPTPAAVGPVLGKPAYRPPGSAPGPARMAGALGWESDPMNYFFLESAIWNTNRPVVASPSAQDTAIGAMIRLLNRALHRPAASQSLLGVPSSDLDAYADGVLQAAQRQNLRHAVAYARLLLGPEFTLRELFLTITRLSYYGDVRTLVGAEDPRKVANIVDNQFPLFAALYAPVLGELLDYGSGLDRPAGESFADFLARPEALLRQPVSRVSLNQLFTAGLPPAMAVRVVIRDLHRTDFLHVMRSWTHLVEGPRALFGASPYAGRLLVLRTASQSNLRSSVAQTLKGLWTAGPLRAAIYARAKLQKGRAKP